MPPRSLQTQRASPVQAVTVMVCSSSCGKLESKIIKLWKFKLRLLFSPWLGCELQGLRGSESQLKSITCRIAAYMPVYKAVPENPLGFSIHSLLHCTSDEKPKKNFSSSELESTAFVWLLEWHFQLGKSTAWTSSVLAQAWTKSKPEYASLRMMSVCSEESELFVNRLFLQVRFYICILMLCVGTDHRGEGGKGFK